MVSAISDREPSSEPPRATGEVVALATASRQIHSLPACRKLRLLECCSVNNVSKNDREPR
jgi:hypothetical protein